MIVSKENCKDCPWFNHENANQENMIKNNICPKRETAGCPSDEVKK